MRKLAEDFRYDRIRTLHVVSTAEKRIPEGSSLDFIPWMIILTVLAASFRDASVLRLH